MNEKGKTESRTVNTHDYDSLGELMRWLSETCHRECEAVGEDDGAVIRVFGVDRVNTFDMDDFGEVYLKDGDIVTLLPNGKVAVDTAKGRPE